MKKISKVSLILMVMFSFLLILYNNCFSAQWMHVKTNDNGLKAYVDFESICVIPNNMVKYWSKYVENDGSYLLSHDLINYKDKTNTTLRYAQFDNKGRLIEQGKNLKQLYMVPGTVYEALFNFVVKIKGLK
jgi:hypothetical protein